MTRVEYIDEDIAGFMEEVYKVDTGESSKPLKQVFAVKEKELIDIVEVKGAIVTKVLSCVISKRRYKRKLAKYNAKQLKRRERDRHNK